MAGNITSNVGLTLSDGNSTLNVSKVPSLNTVNVSATGGTLNFSAATSLTNVNLTAASGGQLLFPVATSLSDNGDTIQASGNGSYINLS